MEKLLTKDKSFKPSWTPKNAGKEFAVSIIKGVDGNSKDVMKNKINIKSKSPSVAKLAKGVLEDNRNLLARTITLIESNSTFHHKKATEILDKLLPHSGNSIRIGVSGVPGAGKSTMIETLGLYLITLGHKVAVLTVDPSSSVSKGSILGDKTRMEKLSREANCFIRPSPSGGNLGGVTRKTRETITACEAAGFDIIIIETVGVGQSEITVRSMVDFFLLVMIAGAGDELQGIKKGIIEISDALVFNKADGANKQKVKIARAEFATALHYLTSYTRGWETKALIASALDGVGIKEVWETVLEFVKQSKKNNNFDEERKRQSLEWMYFLIDEKLKSQFYQNSKIKEEIINIEQQILDDKLLATTAADLLLNKIYK